MVPIITSNLNWTRGKKAKTRILLSTTSLSLVAKTHRIRINTEENAKVVTAAWGTEFIQFLAALAILHQNDLKKRMNRIMDTW